MVYNPMWGGFATQVRDTGNRLRLERPQAWNKCKAPGDDGEFIRLLAGELHLTQPAVGLNGKRGNPDDMSKDVLAFPNATGCRDRSGTHAGLELVDVIVGHEGPNASIGWLDITVNPDTGAPFADGYWLLPPAVPAVHATRLGCSLFWGLAGYQKYRPQLDANLHWIKGSLGADCVRVFGVLGGDLFGGVDPWLDLATNWRSNTYRDLVRDFTNYVYDTHGLKTQWTLVGGRAQVPDILSQQVFINTFSDAIGNITQKVEYVEVWNEYLVNNAVRSELRQMGRQVRQRLGDAVPVALSSPSSIMGGAASGTEVREEINALYGGDVATLMTIHPTRPEPIWNAETLQTLTLGLPIAVGEPRGPGASAGGDVDNPAIIAADYQSAVIGGAVLYVFHPKGGIWGGHCNGFPGENSTVNIFEHHNAEQIAAALKAIRRTGTTPTVPGGQTMNPYPSEPTWWADFEAKVAEKYAAHGQPVPAQAFEAGRWFARTSYDICAGVTKEESMRKHLEELEEALP